MYVYAYSLKRPPDAIIPYALKQKQNLRWHSRPSLHAGSAMFFDLLLPNPFLSIWKPFQTPCCLCATPFKTTQLYDSVTAQTKTCELLEVDTHNICRRPPQGKLTQVLGDHKPSLTILIPFLHLTQLETTGRYEIPIAWSANKLK